MDNWLKGKTAIIIGERDGVQGPAIAACLEAAGANVVFKVTECFVWTAAGTMDPENQGQVKTIAERAQKDMVPKSDMLVVLGASDLDGVMITAETVTTGDPTFSGPLAGVSLGLPVYHILEPDVRAMIPEDVYEENVGIWTLAVEQERLDKIGQELKMLREKGQSNG